MKIFAREGDSFWLYSQIFHIPVQLIEDSNPGIVPSSLQAGREINIPGFVKKDYRIKTGDSLWKVAKKHNISVDAIQLLNPSIPPHLIADEIIKIPERITTFVIDDFDNYDFHKLEKDIQKLTEIYPFIKVNKIGSSVLGKPIYELETGRGNRVVHFNASFHANEWITTPVLMRLLNEFALALTNSKTERKIFPLPLYHRNCISVVPMVNPDGVNLVLIGPPEERKDEVIQINGGSTDFTRWKANIRGVDLNNQFPANWEIEKKRKEPKAPAPRDYPGDEPLTEPEAIAMARLARERDFARLLAFHTQGREFYWGYAGKEPEESEILARRYALASGYEPVRNIDSHAGYRDWFIQQFQKPGFTFELGYGVNPLPISQFSQIYKEMQDVFLVSLQ